MNIPEDSFCLDRRMNSWDISKAGLKLMIGKVDLIKRGRTSSF
jgi:hypothetical protein